MTPADLILQQLAHRDMGFNDLMRATRLPRSTLRKQLDALADDGLAYLSDPHDGRRTWHFGADPHCARHTKRDYSVLRELVAPGHTVVRFGDRWRAGHGQKPPSTPGRANALGNIYA